MSVIARVRAKAFGQFGTMLTLSNGMLTVDLDVVP